MKRRKNTEKWRRREQQRWFCVEKFLQLCDSDISDDEYNDGKMKDEKGKEIAREIGAVGATGVTEPQEEDQEGQFIVHSARQCFDSVFVSSQYPMNKKLCHIFHLMPIEVYSWFPCYLPRQRVGK